MRRRDILTLTTFLLPYSSGEGDLHDPAFDEFGASTVVLNQAHLPEGSLSYKVTFYPNKNFDDTYRTKNPMISMIGAVLVMILTSTLFFSYDFFVRKEFHSKDDLVISKEIERLHLEVDKRASEKLLDNVLPKEVATRLKNDPGHLAEHHPNATILFADIVGFTALSNQHDASYVVSFLNDLFTRFDGALDKYGLNKIKSKC